MIKKDLIEAITKECKEKDIDVSSDLVSFLVRFFYLPNSTHLNNSFIFSKSFNIKRYYYIQLIT